MKKAGFNVVRLAEFAWAFLEPEEGRFEFDWLDEALEVLGRCGIAAILCTPTAVMPAWVARKYPEALVQNADGSRVVWGVRKNNCFTSGAYRLLSERITRAMAEHFRGARNVIGWQTDNEFGGSGNSQCHCAGCRGAFQDWLRSRYGTLAELNRAWGTHFWGHRVARWDEVHTPPDAGTHNPSLTLDWRRFVSHLNVRFQADQVRILRQVCPKHFVTHNFMGLFTGLDYFDLARDLDFVSWDNYPVWGAPAVRYDASLAADVMRGLKRKNFWIMEQTAGPGGWSSFGRNPRPGEIRSIAYQQLAHGADGTLWFRWRTCTAGREQYWHGLLGHDGRAGRRYREAARTAEEFHKLAPALAGTTTAAQAAVLYDYDSIWALEIQPGYAGNRFVDAVRRYYAALFRAGVGVDVVHPSADLSKYRLVVAADLYVLPDAVADALVAYVRRGGVLLADCRTGVKDPTNLCHARTLPGRLSPALGVEIPEYEALAADMEYPLVGAEDFAGAFTAVQYVDWVVPKRARRLAGYDQWHLRRYAAVTRNACGEGVGWYVGTVAKEPVFYDRLVERLLADARIRPAVRPPEGVEACVRRGRGTRLLFLINHAEQSRRVAVPAGRRELLTGRQTGGTVDLKPHGVAVIRL